MGLAVALLLITCGMLGAAQSILKHRPDAKKVIDKLRPYQGWLGTVACVWGLVIIVWTLIRAGHLLDASFFSFLTVLLAGILCAALGLVLGYNLLYEYVFSRSEQAARRGAEVRDRIAPYQESLGWVAIGWGVWSLIASIIW